MTRHRGVMGFCGVTNLPPGRLLLWNFFLIKLIFYIFIQFFVSIYSGCTVTFQKWKVLMACFAGRVNRT